VDDKERYLNHARMCRERAARLSGAAAAKWLKLAAEYEALAERAGSVSPTGNGPQEQQPVAMQQHAAREGE